MHGDDPVCEKIKCPVENIGGVEKGALIDHVHLIEVKTKGGMLYAVDKLPYLLGLIEKVVVPRLDDE